MAEREVSKDLILPESGFWSGVARLLNFGGSQDRATIEAIRERYRNPPPIPSTEDAIRATWQSVGDSMRWAIGEYEKTLPRNGTNGDKQTVETEQLRSNRKQDPVTCLRGVDADENTTRSALHSANDSLLRALARYKTILGEQDKK